MTLHKTTQGRTAEERLFYKAIDRRRWQWLGHVLRMSPDRNAHKALKLLDFEHGSLVHHH